MPEDIKMPNASLYVLILAAEEVMGKNGLATVLNQGGLSYLVGKIPPNNLELEIPFSLYGKVQQAIEDFYGPRGSKAILMRVGRALFRYTLHERPALMGVGSLALKALPTGARQKLIMTQIIKAATEQTKMPSELEEDDDAFIMTRQVCPCQFRSRDSQLGACDHVSIGSVMEALKWATGKDYKVTQTKCLNTGDPEDRFEINKSPMDN